jgi:predicted short-subunit dehydrogenase-like oxidoreductase (DUF2520 family)
MNISIIGTGNVAYVLARLCKSKGHFIKQIIGRNEAKGSLLAQEVQSTYISLQSTPDKNVDICIVALSDNSFSELAKNKINFGNVLVVHTAGAISMEVLKTVSTNIGVLYPLQSLRKEMNTIPAIPFLIEANNGDSFNMVEVFANTLSEKVQYLPEEKRIRLNAGAVVVSNFTNYLYGLTETFCKKEGVDFDLLKPLIVETATRIQNVSPIEVQTGPAIRKDISTLERHLRLLSPHPSLKIWYTRFSDAIIEENL